jgi:hypothetical protein
MDNICAVMNSPQYEVIEYNTCYCPDCDCDHESFEMTTCDKCDKKICDGCYNNNVGYCHECKIKDIEEGLDTSGYVSDEITGKYRIAEYRHAKKG